MESASQQNAAMAEHTSAAAVELAERAKEMDELVRFFRTEGRARAVPAPSRPRLVARA